MVISRDIKDIQGGYQNAGIGDRPIREMMATKAWLSAMLAQSFAMLGGVAGLFKLLH